MQFIPLLIVVGGYLAIIIYAVCDHVKTRNIRKSARQEIDKRRIEFEQEQRFQERLRKYYGVSR